MTKLTYFMIGILFWAGITLGKEGSKPKGISITGYIQVLWKYDFRREISPNNEFQIRRGRIKFRKAISNDLLTTLEINWGKARLEVKDVYFEYRITRALNFVVGQHKMPFSRGELRSASKLLVIERGEVNDFFDDYGYLGRDVGISVKGEILKDRFPIDYAFGVFNGSGYRVFGDIDNAKQFAERVTLAPANDFSIGINSTQRTDSITGERMIAYGGDFSCQRGGATVEGEILLGNTAPDKTMLGYYLVGSYRFGCFEPAVKVERLHPDSKQTDDCFAILTYGLNWYFHKKTRLQVNLVRNIPYEQEPYYTIVTQAQVKF